MVTIDSGIVFDCPQTWERINEGSRYVFRTSQREEIIISANRVSGNGPSAERSQVIERIFTNGLEAAKRAASHPDLKVTKPLAEDSGVSPFRCATILAETIARDVSFGQAVLQHSEGVVLITYEAPFVEGAEQRFRELLKMVRHT